MTDRERFEQLIIASRVIVDVDQRNLELPHSCGQCECCAAWRMARESQPRTCGTCRHRIAGQCNNSEQLQSTLSYMDEDDGCLKGWEVK